MDRAPPRIFDRTAYRARRARAAAAQAGTFLAGEAAEQIAQRLDATNRRFRRALDLNSRRDAFAALAPHAETWVRTGPPTDSPAVIADEEALPFRDESFDLVTSVLSLHAVNDIPGALMQIRRVLRPDGLFIGALFGGETLKELRHAFAAAESDAAGGASPRVAPFADVRNLGGLLQRANFALPVADLERTVVRYRDLARLFADLRALGETNVLSGRQMSFLSRKLLNALVAAYGENFRDEDERYRATFDIVFLTGWAPHASQQQPLEPGSARMRLADALGTVENPTGEKPPRRNRD